MLFKTHRHSFLTALMAILALTGSAGCWGMEQSLINKGFLNISTLRMTIAEANAAFSGAFSNLFRGLFKGLDKNNVIDVTPKRGYLSRFGHSLLSFVKSDAKVNGFWNKTKNIVKNLSKSVACTGIAAITHYCALPDAQTPIQTALCYGVTTLGYTLGAAAAIRMVQAPFVNGWNVGSDGTLYMGSITGIRPDGKPITQEDSRLE